MQKYFTNYAGATGIAIKGAEVIVTKPDGSPAAIFSDNGVTPITSLKTGPDGEFAFYAANGSYTITLRKRGLKDETVNDVLIFDPYADPFATLQQLRISEGAKLIGFGDSTVGDILAPLAEAVDGIDEYVGSALTASEEAVAASNRAVDASQAVIAGQNGGVVGFDTLASLNANLNYADKTVAYVTNDPTPANNATYRKVGANGTGSWVLSAGTYASTVAVEQAKKAAAAAAVRLRPRGRMQSDAALFSFGGAQVRLPAAQNIPRSRVALDSLSIMLGNTPVSLVNPARVAALEERAQVVQEEVEAGYAPLLASWVVEPATVSGEAQVMAYDGSSYRQITPAGTNWRAPVAGPFNIVRCLAGLGVATRSYSVTPRGFVLTESGCLITKLVTGQSLSLGSRGYVLNPNGEYEFQAGSKGDLFTTSIPLEYQNYCLSLAGGPRPINWQASTAFEPIREYADGVTGETISSSWALAMRKWAIDNTRIDPRVLVTVSGLGGVPYASLKKGTTIYSRAIAQITKAHEIATAAALQHVVSSVSIVHGESQTETTQAQYVAMLAEWIANYRADIVAITGQAVAPVGFVSQMLTGETGTIPAIPLAQLEAHNANPDLCLIGPKYAYPYFDVYHMLAEGYVKIGELEARAERFHLAGQKWQPLKPVTAVAVGSTVVVTFNNVPNGLVDTPGPIGELVLDTETISDPGNFGFSVTGVTITAVSLGKDGLSVVLTLSAAPASGAAVGYALQAGLGNPSSGNGRRGNVRDSDRRDKSRFDNTYLYNWSVAHSTPITF